MCLITEQEKPQIAEKDIICYKVIRKNMTSLYYNNFKWEFGKIYTSSVEDFERPNYNAINQAFHSFDSLEGLKKSYYMVTQPCLAVKCTIPRGSRFYWGKHNYIDGYASNQLIINGMIGIKELYPDFDWDNYPYKEGQVIKCRTSYDKIKKDYQITNIQPSPIYKNRVDLIVDFDCIVITKFDGEAWFIEEDNFH